jgi:hypothetical protein
MNYGWEKAINFDSTWYLAYGNYQIQVYAGQNWLYIRVPLMFHEQFGFWMDMIQLSELFHLCRLCRDQNNKLYLEANWPLTNLSFTVFKMLLMAMTQALQKIDTKYPTGISDPSKHGNPSIQQNSFRSSQSSMALYIPKELIWKYVRQIDMYGWGLAKEPENTRWLFVYRSHTARFQVYMIFTENWTYFLAPIQTQVCDLGVLWSYILQIHCRMTMARFRLTESDGIVLTIQCPTDQLTFPVFQSCMHGMALYLDRFVPEIILLGNSKRLCKYISTGELPPSEYSLLDYSLEVPQPN